MPSCEARVGEVQAAQRTGQDLREYRPAGVFWHDVKAFRSGVGVLLTALMIPPVIARIHAEERLLRTEFGDAYDAYRARTSRLISRLY